MTQRRVAVTGAAGVIGREMLSRLIASGAEVLSLDRKPLAPELAAHVTHVQVDLAEGGMDEIRAFAPTEIYHLAAAFERSVEEPDFWLPNYRDNIVVAHRLHTLLRELSSVETYVFASSYLIYRPDLYLYDTPQETARRLKEDDPVNPRNLCGAAKFLAEREIDFLLHVDRLPLRTVSARIYRVYGRGSRCVISRWVRALLRREEIQVFNAAGRFDYVFAGDVAEGLLRLGASPRAKGVINLATGRSRRVAEVVEVLRRSLNADGLIRSGADTGPFEASEADTSRLEAATGWKPATTIEDGISQVLDYERKRLAAAL